MKIAVVTGASRGIGAVIAQRLASDGHSLLLTARDENRLQALSDQLGGPAANIYHHPADLTDTSQAYQLFDRAKSLFSHIDVLINNAGGGVFEPIEATSDETWENILAANLTTTFKACRSAIPLLRASSAPIILNMSSIAGIRGFHSNSAYAASKGGIIALSNALREELRADGIRVTCLCPGATNSTFWDNVEGEWDRSRMMSPETIAQTVAHIIAMPESASVDQIVMMPTGGAL